MSREQASDRYGLPTFVGHAYRPADNATATSVTLLSTEHPAYVAEALFGLEVD